MLEKSPESLSLPEQLTENKDLLIDKDGRTYTVARALKGRGQAGIANFYQCEQISTQLLIKEDDLATCILEGTAYFAQQAHVLPNYLTGSVNFARLGVLYREDGTTKFVSVQPAVQPLGATDKVKPWDEIVYGRKRNPKTLYSEESWYPKAVTQNINQLPSMVQWQLAAGIFSSMLAGDESLHVGQFMAVVNDQYEVTGVIRIDLGARERYAQRRTLLGELSPYNASNSYQSYSWGQGGKNYIQYLLSSPELAKKYTILWAGLHPSDLQSIYKASQKAILDTFAKIPIDYHESALKELLKVINKGIKEPEKPLATDPSQDIQLQIQYAAEKIAELDSIRAANMREHALTEFLSSNAQKETIILTEYGPGGEGTVQSNLLRLNQFGKNCILKDEEIESDIDYHNTVYALRDHLTGLLHQLPAKFSIQEEDSAKIYGLLNRISFVSEMILDAKEIEKRSIMRQSDKGEVEDLEGIFKEIDDFCQSIRTINELCQYSISSHTPSTDKKIAAFNMLKKLSIGEEALKQYIQENAEICEIMARVGSTSSWIKGDKSTGQALMESLVKRYDLPIELASMNAHQFWLYQHIRNGDFNDALSYFSTHKLSCNDLLMPDRAGKTTLHYLMQHANSDAAYTLITTILQSSIGVSYNTNLDIPDHEDKTPMYYLAQNPSAASFEGYLKAHPIKGYWGGVYQITDFFKPVAIEIEPIMAEQSFASSSSQSQQGPSDPSSSRRVIQTPHFSSIQSNSNNIESTSEPKDSVVRDSPRKKKEF